MGLSRACKLHARCLYSLNCCASNGAKDPETLQQEGNRIVSMFCYQCEQTYKGTGCAADRGVCGKDAETAAVQDILLQVLKGVSQYAHQARELGCVDHEIDVFAVQALFATVTNVNFDAADLKAQVARAVALRTRAREMYENACEQQGKTPQNLAGPAIYLPPDDTEGLMRHAEQMGVQSRADAVGEDVAGVQELMLYGLKGAAAYADHAQILGQEDDEVYGRFHAVLAYLAQNDADLNGLLGQALGVGELNLQVMQLLDAGHTESFGHPVPTPVSTGVKQGKAILISGHDLKDLEALLEQTEGRGVNVYTHGEMLPAHGYPAFNKYSHLVGNYGGAWQKQRNEFDAFPGAILLTTNCLMPPRPDYEDRLFTAGLVRWPGVKHVEDRDFSAVIEAALAADGFAEDEANGSILVGFGRNAVLSQAGAVVDAVKQGAVRHFFLIGGCDGARPGRNYFTDLAEAVPDDCIILTLACGKYRFNKLDFGDIGGIPRLLDIGQCNDAYSAIQIAVALAEAFETDVNSLPLSMILSWYEQKAVAILLTLLHLGVQNIRLGPTLPAFVTPAVLNVLVEKFAIKPVTSPEEDLYAILG